MTKNLKNENKIEKTEYLSALEFDYDLPEELIAQFPLKKRDTSKMMRISRGKKTIEHKVFSDFSEFLNKDDVLVLNNTKVLPARLLGYKETGAKIEIFLLHPAGQNGGNNTENGGQALWYALIRNLKRLKEGDIVKISEDFSIKLIKKGDSSNSGPDENLVELLFSGNITDVLEKYGEIPLPPYIQRENVQEDKNTYQTVFAKIPGSVAAPTAGLHFTSEVLKKIEQKGVKIVYVTLNVGLGTFLPVKEDNVLNHKMHTESFEIPEDTAKIINETLEKKAAGGAGNIVSVGTTVTRTLEATYKKYGKIMPVKDETDIFIYPPYEFKVIDKLLTNFHLPKSTLIMLVSALAGKDFILKAYKKAVEEKYRFFSYGDCMFIDK